MTSELTLEKTIKTFFPQSDTDCGIFGNGNAKPKIFFSFAAVVSC